MTKVKEILPEQIWNKKKREELRKFIAAESAKQSPEQKLRVELLAIKYKLEDYIEENDSKHNLTLVDFIKMYLKVFNVSQKRLATLFEMKDSNLHKYLVGERKLNADLAMKIGAFTHTDPEYWFRLELKNDLSQLRTKAVIKEYAKYDYVNLSMVAEP